MKKRRTRKTHLREQKGSGFYRRMDRLGAVAKTERLACRKGVDRKEKNRKRDLAGD
ncbi:hypothetical protein MPNT_620005 [Candidatus Methylacidithermus pantelleriae]|uniref:Uncharacterized protein n=1 Tax=Candidatus Methylacidithermus pantelleriae TaxID=2744239 RepID=A0A8J2BSG6_9BACT|nr:hypothetical protein MPNT_620005 [Candidatus Methylacidithermus pantelleriae]